MYVQNMTKVILVKEGVTYHAYLQIEPWALQRSDSFFSRGRALKINEPIPWKIQTEMGNIFKIEKTMLISQKFSLIKW